MVSKKKPPVHTRDLMLAYSEVDSALTVALTLLDEPGAIEGQKLGAIVELVRKAQTANTDALIILSEVKGWLRLAWGRL